MLFRSRFAAKANGLRARARFHVGDAAQGLRKLAETGAPDAVVVDPPRRGLAPPVIETIVASGAQQVVYVACDPFTFGRDLAALTQSFALVSVRPVDLFPRTLHLEAVALLRRK